MLCLECGHEMNLNTIQKARPQFRRGIKRWTCPECKYEESNEWTNDKLENDAIEEKLKEANKKSGEPFEFPEYE